MEWSPSRCARFFLPDSIFLPSDHGLDFDISLSHVRQYTYMEVIAVEVLWETVC